MNGGMKMIAALALLAVVAPSLDASAAPAVRKAARATPAVPADWTKRVAVTADGGFLVGNPGAKAKLVEYASLSCPYCRRFHQEAIAGLRARIATSRVSFEFRPFAVHSADPILNALLRCAGPANFLKFSDDFYDDQMRLAAAFESWAEANPTTNPNATAADRIKYSAQWGFTAFAAAHGVPQPRIAPCLTNRAALSAQQQREDTANSVKGVKGTPTFFLNDQKLTTYTWPEIDQAIGTTLGATS